MDLVKITERTNSLVQEAKGLLIRSEVALQAAGGIRQGLKALMDEIRHGYDENIQNAHKTWKGLIATRNEYLQPNEEAEAILNRKMSAYMVEREKKRLEVLEKARKAKEEKDRLEREAKEKLEEKIEAAEKKEDFEEVEKLVMEEPAPAPVQAVRVPEKLKVEGSYMITTWKYEVTDLEKVPRPLLMLDHVKTNKIVQFQKEKTNIPGIRVYSTSKMASRKI